MVKGEVPAAMFEKDPGSLLHLTTYCRLPWEEWMPVHAVSLGRVANTDFHQYDALVSDNRRTSDKYQLPAGFPKIFRAYQCGKTILMFNLRMATCLQISESMVKATMWVTMLDTLGECRPPIASTPPTMAS